MEVGAWLAMQAAAKASADMKCVRSGAGALPCGMHLCGHEERFFGMRGSICAASRHCTEQSSSQCMESRCFMRMHSTSN